MFPSLSFHCTKDGSNHRAADADKGDHDDEPADADGLRHGDAAARLGLGPAMAVVRMDVSDSKSSNKGLTRDSCSLNIILGLGSVTKVHLLPMIQLNIMFIILIIPPGN